MPLRLLAAAAAAAACTLTSAGLLQAADAALVVGQLPLDLVVLGKLMDLGGWAVMAGAMFWLMRDQHGKDQATTERLAETFAGELRQERAWREETTRTIAATLGRLTQQCQVCRGGGDPTEIRTCDPH